MNDMNNFHGYMPGGFYRYRHENTKYKLEGKRLELLEAIDNYIEESGFDLQRYLRLIKIVKTYFDRYCDAVNSGDFRKMEYTERRFNQFKKFTDPLEREVFEKMLSLGFDRLLLIQ